MKYIKSLGLFVVAAAAMMAFAASASATSITSPTGTVLAAGSTLHAESVERAVPGTRHVIFHNAIASVACQSTITFTFDHNSGGISTGAVHSWSLFNCTNEWVVDTISGGNIEIQWTSGYNGTVKSTGAKITATRAGLSCVYETSSTDIGTITGGSPARLDFQGALPRVGGSFLCGGAMASITGEYATTSAYYFDP